MLINLRNALMAGKRLPYDAEVEYLESTGTQWIDTGLPIAPNFYLDATFSIPSLIPHVLIFMGTTTQYRPYYRFWVCSIQTNKTINCGLINNALSTATLTANEPSNVYVKFFDGEQVCKLDGTTIVSATNTSDSSAKAAWLAQGNLLIGRSSLDESFNFVGKIFAVKIYDANNTLVRDFIPVRRGTVGYLYDRVTGRLFGNAGSGDFALGPDVVPVEYLESHGTEYIDTGVPATGATDSEFQFKMSVAGFAFGARTAWNASAYSLNYAAGNYALNYGNNSVVADLKTNIRIDTNWHTAKIQSGGVLSLDEWTGTAGTFYFTTNGSLILFGTRQGSSLNLTASGFKYCKIWDNSLPVRSFRPIRVGTEGAMMDVLTRRIYRNAGTGAFAYGNDLKYPIPAE